MRNKWIVCAGCAAAVLVLCVLGVLRPWVGQQEPPQAEFPIVSILTIGDADSDALARVSAALSEITIQRIGCRVELQMIREDEYDERIDDLLLKSDFADVFVCRDRTTMNKLMQGSYIYRLDRYLSSRPKLFSAVDDDSAWERVQSQGYTYGIPFGSSGSSAWGFLMRGDVCEQLDIDPTEITTLEQLHRVLLQVLKSYPDMIPVVTDHGRAQTFASETLLIAGAGCLLVDGQVKDVCELTGFQERCALMEQWRQERLIQQNGQLNRAGRESWMAEGMAFGSFAQLDRYTVRELEYALGVPVECAVLEEAYYGNGQPDMSFSVYAYTKDVDLCLQVLELIYTDEEALRLCVYGEEGTDYVLLRSGAVEPVEGCEYYNWCWPMRELVAPPISTEDPEWYEEQGNAFWFDNRSVSGEIYQCGEVLKKYYEALCAGMLDAETGIARMSEELKGANQALVRAELERQWRTWQENH